MNLSMRILYRLVGLAVVALPLAGCSGTASAASPRLIASTFTEASKPQLKFSNLAWSPDPGGSGAGRMLLLTVTTNGATSLATVRSDGSGSLRAVTVPASAAVGGVWSPDGKSIAYAALRDDTNSVCQNRCAYEIYRMAADGSQVKRLTNGTDFYDAPDWSPDGALIVFDTVAWTGLQGIATVKADGTDFTQLTNQMDSAPVWSPDGSRIAFRSSRELRSGIYVMNRDGSDITFLGDGSVHIDGLPIWSPDGAHVIAEGDVGSSETGIYLFGIGPEAPVPLTDDLAQYQDVNPSWSADGRQLVFQSDRQLHINQIFTIDVSRPDSPGRITATQLTHGAGPNYAPVWSPEAGAAGGGQIAYVSQRNGFPDIYVMDPDGSNVVRLTNNPGNQMCLKWPF